MRKLKIKNGVLKAKLLIATFEVIVPSIGSTNPIKKGNKKNKDKSVNLYKCNRLVSIKGELAGNIDTVDLQKFCFLNLIRIHGDFSKMPCAIAIVKAKEN